MNVINVIPSSLTPVRPFFNSTLLLFGGKRENLKLQNYPRGEMVFIFKYAAPVLRFNNGIVSST